MRVAPQEISYQELLKRLSCPEPDLLFCKEDPQAHVDVIHKFIGRDFREAWSCRSGLVWLVGQFFQ